MRANSFFFVMSLPSSACACVQVLNTVSTNARGCGVGVYIYMCAYRRGREEGVFVFITTTQSPAECFSM